MGEINNIKQLKELIKDLPDDMPIKGYDGGNGSLYQVSYWINSKETLDEEELQSYIDAGESVPLLVISVG
jgi:hypothetical protein